VAFTTFQYTVHDSSVPATTKHEQTTFFPSFPRTHYTASTPHPHLQINEQPPTLLHQLPRLPYSPLSPLLLYHFPAPFPHIHIPRQRIHRRPQTRPPRRALVRYSTHKRRIVVLKGSHDVGVIDSPNDGPGYMDQGLECEVRGTGDRTEKVGWQRVEAHCGNGIAFGGAIFIWRWAMGGLVGMLWIGRMGRVWVMVHFFILGKTL